jgi:predicted homoserine dehydrogenase-like protein
LTRRNLVDFSTPEIYTNSINELIDRSQLVVECAGDPIYGTDVVSSVLDASLPVVTMDAELQVTSGTYLSSKGYLTEAEGDQPGALAALHRDALAMGFMPLVYGNLKGFLNHNPTLDEMQYWSMVQGISLDQVTSFTDGTKLQLEQALVANGLGAAIAIQGLYGFQTEDIDVGSKQLAEKAQELGTPISDYLLSAPQAKKKLPAGVFLTAEIDPRQGPALKYLKLGEGPYYTLLRNYHLCHLEIPKTIREVINGGDILLDNSASPTASVAVIAKKPINVGTRIERALGSFLVRGEAIPIKSMPNHLPVGLMGKAVITRPIEPGQMITFDDVEIPDTLALKAWRYTLQQIGLDG